MKSLRIVTLLMNLWLLASCVQDKQLNEFGLVDGPEVESISVVIDDPQTRVGVEVDDANKVDKYHWIAEDKIWLLELNGAGDAFTGNRYEYKYLATQIDKKGVFQGKGAVVGREYIPVHVRKESLINWPVVNGKYLEFTMPDFEQTGLWSEADVRQAFVDLLLFVGPKFTMANKYGSLINLKHMLTQVELGLTANNVEDEGEVLKNVLLNCEGNNYASKLSIGVTGGVDETTCTWGNRSGSVTLKNATDVLLGNVAYKTRLLVYQKSKTSVPAKIIAGYGRSAPTTEKTLSTGKVYKLNSTISYYLYDTDIKIPYRNMLAEQRMLNRGEHSLKLDFKNSVFQKLKVRVKSEIVNTTYTHEGVADSKITYINNNGADGDELAQPTTELLVNLPQNTEVNLLRKITVEYKGDDGAGNVVWKSDRSPTIYQDGVPFNSSPKEYMVRYSHYPEDIVGNSSIIVGNQEYSYNDGIATWMPTTSLMKPSLLDIAAATDAVNKALLTNTVDKNIPGVTTDIRVKGRPKCTPQISGTARFLSHEGINEVAVLSGTKVFPEHVCAETTLVIGGPGWNVIKGKYQYQWMVGIVMYTHKTGNIDLRYRCMVQGCPVFTSDPYMWPRGYEFVHWMQTTGNAGQGVSHVIDDNHSITNAEPVLTDFVLAKSLLAAVREAGKLGVALDIFLEN